MQKRDHGQINLKYARIVEDISKRISNLTKELIDEIKSHQNLTEAENSELIINPVPISTMEILSEVLDIFIKQNHLNKNYIKVDEFTPDLVFINDKILLKRVIINLIKNALEASDKGQSVIIGCNEMEKQIQFWVNNKKPVPSEIQLQIFKRFFSTKGKRRGLGLYSVKLLSERYLKGNVTFASSPESGTTFKVTYPLILNN